MAMFRGFPLFRGLAGNVESNRGSRAAAIRPDRKALHLRFESLELRLNLSGIDVHLQNLYRYGLNRDAAPDELAALTARIESGRTTVERVARGILTSPEHRNFAVASQYHAIFGRAPGAAARDRYEKIARETGSEERVIAAMIGSAEFGRGKSPQAWVDQAYRKLLGRAASADEIARDTAALARGSTRAQVALKIVRSRDYAENFVEQAHKDLLGRLATTSEVDTWADTLGRRGGWRSSLHGVITAIAATEEAAEKLSSVVFVSIAPGQPQVWAMRAGMASVALVGVQPPSNVLPALQKMYLGDSIANSSDGSVMTFRADGNLVVGDQTKPVRWDSGTAGLGAQSLYVDALGRLGIYDANGALLWTGGGADAKDIPGGRLYVQAGGFSVRSDTAVGYTTTFVGTLPSGRAIERKMSVASLDGRTRLEMQVDGNAVVYRDGLKMWETGTTDGDWLAMETIGDLAVRRLYFGTPRWSLNTASVENLPANSWLEMIDGGFRIVAPDGRVVQSTIKRGELQPGQDLIQGARLFSADGRQVLQLSSPTPGSDILKLSLTEDGQEIWAVATTNDDWALSAFVTGAGDFKIGNSVWSMLQDAAALPVENSKVVFVERGISLVAPDGSTVASTRFVDELKPGQAIIPRGSAVSADGRTQLLTSETGVLALLHDGATIWTSGKDGPAGNAARYRTIQLPDGNLAVQEVSRADGGWPRTTWDFATSLGLPVVPGSTLKITDGAFSVIAPGGRAVFATQYRDQLLTGQVLTPETSVVSADGWTRLRLRADGNLVVERAGQQVWESATAGRATFARMRADGNLALTDAAGNVVWDMATATGQPPVPGSWLELVDGGFSIIGPDGRQLQSTRYTGGLQPGQSLMRGTSVISADGRTEMRFQADGNLVVGPPGGVCWFSGTANAGADYVTLDTLGELTIRSIGGQVLWSSRPYADIDVPGARLTVQAGGFEIRSDTVIGFASTYIGTLTSGRALWPRMAVATPDGRTRLEMQSDGNLVVIADGVNVFDFGTTGKATVAVMQTDGNLVLRDDSGSVAWDQRSQTNRPVFAGSRIDMVEGGFAVVAPDGRIIMASVYRDRLEPLQVLLPRSAVISSDGRTVLRFQPDSNLVLYHDSVAVWESATTRFSWDTPDAAKEIVSAAMYTDGDFGFRSRYFVDGVLFVTKVWGLAGNTGQPVVPGSVLTLFDGGFALVAPDGSVVQSTQYRNELTPGHVLLGTASVLSPDGRTVLRMQSDTNLVLYRDGTPIWATATGREWPTSDYGYRLPRAGFTANGDFQVGNIYSNYFDAAVTNFEAVWSSAAGSLAPAVAGAKLVVADDRLSVITPDGRTAFSTLYADGLLPGQSLPRGGAIVSADGRSRLQFQPDGNLVFSRDGAAMWDSGILATATGMAMRADGELVIVSGSGDAIWSLSGLARIAPVAGSRLALGEYGFSLVAPDGGTVVSTWYADPLLPGQTLTINTRLVSADGRGALILQTDKRLVAYRDGAPVWVASESFKFDYAAMQADGNFVGYGNGTAWFDTLSRTGKAVAGSRIAWLAERASFALVTPAGEIVYIFDDNPAN